MNYEIIKKGFSPQKLQNYTTRLECGSDKELIATYMVIQSIQEKFYVPIQLLELTLRNNLHEAITQFQRNHRNKTVNQSNRWYNYIPANDYAANQVLQAKQKARREINGRGFNHNDVVARLTFGFWVYLLDQPYRLHQSDRQLWPFITDNVFPNRQGKGIPELFNLLITINKTRNRLFHHEPLWLTQTTNTKEKALDNLRNKFQAITDVISYLSNDKMILLDKLNVIDEFSQLCREDTFEEYQNLLPD